jgi:sRNA-binding protein
MDPMSFLPRLQELRDRLRRGRQLGTLDPEVAQHFKALMGELKSAVQQAHADAEEKARAAAARQQEKAEELRKKRAAAKNPPPPAPFPVPWEEHQGLGHDQIHELVTNLLRAASAPPARPHP